MLLLLLLAWMNHLIGQKHDVIHWQSSQKRETNFLTLCINISALTRMLDGFRVSLINCTLTTTMLVLNHIVILCGMCVDF